MPAQLTTKAQVNGYRFLLKRIEHALVRRDVRMLHDPMSSQFRSLVVGLIFALLAVAGMAIMSFLRPQGSVSDSNIIVGKDSGALFVMHDGKLHPVLNLSSARLITGTNEKPTSVKESKLASYPRGPILGIPGAPAALLGSATGDSSTWSLCESTTSLSGGSTLVFSGRPRLGDVMGPVGDDALLVTARSKTYLLYDGKRAEVDPKDDAMVRSLELQGVQPRPIGVGLLNATVAVPALKPPVIPQAGQKGPVHASRAQIGAVIKVSGVNSTDLYVVVPGGVQRISPFAADVIRNADSQGMSDISAVPPDALEGVPVLDTLPLDKFPTTRPKILSAETFPVVCAAWAKPAGDRDSTLTLLAGHNWPLGSSATPVTLATAGSNPDRVDAVYVPPSSGEFVQVTGVEPGSARRESLFYVADNGIRYGVPDLQTAANLGLGQHPKLAPWQILGQLVPGPTLTRSRALVAHDSLP